MPRSRAAQVAALEVYGIVTPAAAGARCVRVLVAEPVASEGIDLLRADHEVDERPGLSRDELCAIIPDYDALIVRSGVQVDAELIAAGTRLAVIGRAGVGVDNVDLDAATRAGIVVVNAPTGNTIAAAEHTLALLYGVARKIAAADASLRRGEWKRAEFTGLELRGRTIGIVGLGKIGQAIAVRARAMEMTVLGVDPFVTAEAAANHGVELVGFDEMLARSDVVTVHVPLTRATRGLIGREAIAKLKPGSIVLNVARGGVLDEAAVAEALRSGHLGGAGIDVFEQEPPTGSPLLDAPNTLLTPHLGASTAEAQVLVSEEVAAQVLDVLAGRSARYAVNAPLLTPETARALAPYLPLAEILGRFFAQFSRGGVRTLTLEIAGELAEYDGTPLTAAVLRGLLETSITERVNLVNAGALAKARGITVVERKTPDAGAFAALLTLSGETGGRTTVVAGTVAAGEPRITRLDDYRLDMAPADNMLITRHMDRPGTVGRVGLMLGEADINISAMHLARTRPREDAFMILALDDDVPDAVSDAIRTHEAVRDLWTIRLGATADRRGSVADRRREPAHPGRPRRHARPRPPRRVDVHRRGPLPGPGGHAAVADRPAPGVARGRAAGAPTRAARPARARAATRSSSSTPRSPRTTQTAEAIERAVRAAGVTVTRRPGPGLPRDPPGRLAGPPSRRGRRSVRSGARRPGAARRSRPGRRAASHSPRSRHGSARPWPRCSRGWAEGRTPGTLDRPQVAGYGDARLDHPWSIVVGHDGVFKVALLTLFDLPLDRFWMWSMDLCGITRRRVPCRSAGPARPQPDRTPRRA